MCWALGISVIPARVQERNDEILNLSSAIGGQENGVDSGGVQRAARPGLLTNWIWKVRESKESKTVSGIPI